MRLKCLNLCHVRCCGSSMCHMDASGLTYTHEVCASHLRWRGTPSHTNHNPNVQHCILWMWPAGGSPPLPPPPHVQKDTVHQVRHAACTHVASQQEPCSTWCPPHPHSAAPSGCNEDLGWTAGVVVWEEHVKDEATPTVGGVLRTYSEQQPTAYTMSAALAVEEPPLSTSASGLPH